MFLICEICGKEIKYPNFIYHKFTRIYDDMYKCAMCVLDNAIDEYMNFKENFPDWPFHKQQLEYINNLTFQLKF